MRKCEIARCASGITFLDGHLRWSVYASYTSLLICILRLLDSMEILCLYGGVVKVSMCYSRGGWFDSEEKHFCQYIVSMAKFGQLVMGPAGSGKSTYCNTVYEHYAAIGSNTAGCSMQFYSIRAGDGKVMTYSAVGRIALRKSISDGGRIRPGDKR